MRVESRQVVGSDSHRNSCTALTSSPEKKGGQSRRQGPIAHKAARVHAAGGPPKAAHGTPMVNSPFQLVHGMDQLLAQHNAGQPAVHCAPAPGQMLKKKARRPRLVWTDGLHLRFVLAVLQGRNVFTALALPSLTRSSCSRPEAFHLRHHHVGRGAGGVHLQQVD